MNATANELKAAAGGIEAALALVAGLPLGDSPAAAVLASQGPALAAALRVLAEVLDPWDELVGAPPNQGER
jgi:hypothetical protein